MKTLGMMLVVWVVAVMIWSADDYTAAPASVTIAKSANLEQIVFALEGGKVATVSVRVIVVARSDTDTNYLTISTNFSRAQLMSAGFTNGANQLLVGSLDPIGPKSFKSWVLGQIGLK